jgi:hypothetical protein
MTKRDRAWILAMIESDGIDYCFQCYSKFPNIKDSKFHSLREAYLKAAVDLVTYIKESGEL